MSENSVIPSNIQAPPEAARDPLSKMIGIAKDDTLSDTDKRELISYAQRKFVNRRRMAYIALMTIVASLFLVFAAAFIDGFTSCSGGGDCTKTGILAALGENKTLVIWTEGFLASIVAAYYGISAWRPAS